MRRWVSATVLLVLAAACSSAPETPSAPLTAASTAATTATTEPSSTPPREVPVVAVPSNSLDGNRYVTGRGNLPTDPIEVEVGGIPLWLTAAPFGDGAALVVALVDGTLTGLGVTAAGVSDLPLDVAALAPGAPPAVIVADGGVSVLTGGSPLTHPVRSGDVPITVSPDGTVRAGEDAVTEAPPDVRPVLEPTGRVAILATPSTAYPHGILGDQIEPTEIVLHDPAAGGTDIIAVADDVVIEGLAPIWADVDGDGARELVVTVSNDVQGAQLVVYGEDGSLEYEGRPIGQGNRWRHQIAAAPIGPGGELEIVDVLTPHIGGVLEFFRAGDGGLDRVTAIDGYTSHVIGSRNLDLAVVADADGDGRLEVVLPTQDLRTLAGLQRMPDGVEERWAVPLPGVMTTNVAAADTAGGLVVAVGTDAGVVWVWPNR